MAVANFVKIVENGSKAKALVQVDEKEVIVEFWSELIEQWGEEGTKTFLCAEALWKTNNFQEAKELLQKDATGTVDKNKDTRNWQQNWLDAHTIPVQKELL